MFLAIEIKKTDNIWPIGLFVDPVGNSLNADMLTPTQERRVADLVDSWRIGCVVSGPKLGRLVVDDVPDVSSMFETLTTG